jgi:hypothetical protein
MTIRLFSHFTCGLAVLLLLAFSADAAWAQRGRGGFGGGESDSRGGRGGPPGGERGGFGGERGGYGGDRGGYGGDRGSFGGDRGSFGGDRGSFGGDRGGFGGDRGGFGGDRGGYGGDRGGGPGGGAPAGGSRDPADFLKRYDANNNGLLEPDEIPRFGRDWIARTAEQAGLDMSQPMPIDKLTAAMQATRESGGGSRDGGSREGSSRGSGNASAPATPGFDALPKDPPKAAGFDKPLETVSTTTSGVSTASGSGNSSSGSRSSGGRNSDSRTTSSSRGSDSQSAASEQAKVASYAQGLLRQYDKNKNGMLERDEWKEMKPEHQAADTNNDGIITVDELALKIASFGTSGNSGTSSSSTGSGAGADRGGPPQREGWGGRGRGEAPSTGSDRGGSDRGAAGGDRGGWGRGGSGSGGDRSRGPTENRQASIRFLTPTERLPKGLPDWFARKDADGDGQVTMSEYITTLDDAAIAEFQKYDLNRDGIITPAECLESLEQEKTARKY